MNFVSRTLPSVIENYLDRRKSAMPLSVSDALKALRAAMPHLALSDRELADMFAAAAIARRRDVAFDLPGENQRRTA